MSVPRVFPYQNQLVAIGIVPPSERSARSVVSGRFRFPFFRSVAWHRSRPPMSRCPDVPMSRCPDVPMSWHRRYGRVRDPELLQIRRVLRRIVVVLPHLVAEPRHLLRIQPNGGLITRRHERLVLDLSLIHI